MNDDKMSDSIDNMETSTLFASKKKRPVNHLNGIIIIY